jgi:hypothetical protein
VIAVHVAQQDEVDFCQTRIVRAGHGAARIVKNSGTNGVFEDQGPVEGAKLAIDQAKGRYFDPGGGGGLACQPGQQSGANGYRRYDYAHREPPNLLRGRCFFRDAITLEVF